jgi:DNA primase small subunit
MVCSISFKIKNEINLSEDFGFEHRLWVYSGRRGVHCWICDPTARELQSSIRQAIVEHLSVMTV